MALKRRKVARSERVTNGLRSADVMLKTARTLSRIPCQSRSFAHFECQSLPCILENGLQEFLRDPKDVKSWKWTGLEKDFQTVEMTCHLQADNLDGKSSTVRMTVGDFGWYSRTQTEEDPLYLFEPSVPQRLKAQFNTPQAFAGDLVPDVIALFPEFSMASEREWLLAGPPGSGSRFHVDPHGTAAWNILLQGRKIWALWPPGDPPAGVPVREEIGLHDVPQAPSALEWFLRGGGEEKDLYMAEQRVGDIIFVPPGWWHCVLNMGDDGMTVAYTSNVITASNVLHAAEVLRVYDAPAAAALMEVFRRRHQESDSE
mmetsp:Transcript_74463/g.198618  ORF Transcript_74463/g.198618 Transcript_74463/m.198618 type:complete len:315 (-) Transcript_74463:152-1096(-)